MTSKPASIHRAFAPAALALGCAIAITAPAAAQAPPKTPPTATTPAPTNCPPHATVTPPGTGSGSTSGQSQEPLGDKLAKSDGVLCPPSNVDPEIRAPTPDVGKTPVIPPPGTPGGDQSVQPK